MYEKVNEFLFFKYQEYYKGEDFHHHMIYDEFLKDPDIYNQIFDLFLDDEDLEKWYKENCKKELRNKKIKRIK